MRAQLVVCGEFHHAVKPTLAWANAFGSAPNELGAKVLSFASLYPRSWTRPRLGLPRTRSRGPAPRASSTRTSIESRSPSDGPVRAADGRRGAGVQPQVLLPMSEEGARAGLLGLLRLRGRTGPSGTTDAGRNLSSPSNSIESQAGDGATPRPRDQRNSPVRESARPYHVPEHNAGRSSRAARRPDAAAWARAIFASPPLRANPRLSRAIRPTPRLPPAMRGPGTAKFRSNGTPGRSGASKGFRAGDTHPWHE